jgi:hypothetical protein
MFSLSAYRHIVAVYKRSLKINTKKINTRKTV